jgi:hypothetical protein
VPGNVQKLERIVQKVPSIGRKPDGTVQKVTGSVQHSRAPFKKWPAALEK